MKLRFKHGILACVLTVSLTVSLLSGCGNAAGTETQSDPTSSDKPETTQSDSSGAEDNSPLGKFEPAIDISFVRCIDDDLASNVLTKTPDETIEDNRWLQLYAEELGINVTYDWTVKGGYGDDAYMQKINMTLTSGNLPDVVPVTASQLKQLADADMIEDMTQYYDEYASELTKAIYTEEGSGVLDSATFDGKLMAIPNADASIECTHYLWLRQDWLDNLGLKAPKTMDDLLKISDAFATQDPDGNGVDDTYGMAVTKDLYSGVMAVQGFFAGYHSYPNFWMEDNSGKLVYGSVQPETKNALKSLADMYAAGQIDKEFGVKDGGKVAESIISGKIGINFGEQWNPMYPLISNYNNDSNADWVGYGLVSADDEKVMVPLNFRTNLYFAVRKGYEHPEAVVKMVNMHLEKNWGETNDFGKYYMPAENDNVGVWKFSPVTPFPPNKNLNAFLEIDAARETGDFSALAGEAKVIQSNLEAYANGDTSQWGWEKIYGADGVYNVLREYQKNDQLMVEKFVGAPTPTMVERLSTLEQMEKEVFVKIIMGEDSIDAFDKFVEDWNALGGSDITNEVNEWYDSLN